MLLPDEAPRRFAEGVESVASGMIDHAIHYPRQERGVDWLQICLPALCSGGSVPRGESENALSHMSFRIDGPMLYLKGVLDHNAAPDLRPILCVKDGVGPIIVMNIDATLLHLTSLVANSSLGTGAGVGRAALPEWLAIAGLKGVGIRVENDIHDATNDLHAGPGSVERQGGKALLPDDPAGPSVQFDYVGAAYQIDVFRRERRYNWRGGRMWLRRVHIHEPARSSQQETSYEHGDNGRESESLLSKASLAWLWMHVFLHVGVVS